MVSLPLLQMAYLLFLALQRFRMNTKNAVPEGSRHAGVGTVGVQGAAQLKSVNLGLQRNRTGFARKRNAQMCWNPKNLVNLSKLESIE